jgi:hypothetical protein
MKRLRLMAVVGALLAIVGTPLAYAAGLWFGLPVVGGASYCAGGSVAGPPGTAVACNSTAPAGPTTTTGNELVPADLNTGGTQVLFPLPGAGVTGSAQTGYLPLPTVASGAYFLTGPLTGLVNATVTIPNGITNVITNLTGTMTTLAYILPLTPVDGQLVRISANATITSAFVTTGQPTGVSNVASVDTPTKVNTFVPSLGATGPTGTYGATYLYNLSGNKWFRTQ